VTSLEPLIRGFSQLSERRRRAPLTVRRTLGAIEILDDEGKRYIEACSGVWCTNLGFDREDLVQAAADQLRELPYYHTLGDKIHPRAVELAERLASLVPVEDPHFFFTVSGSEANDFLVKMIRYANNARDRTAKKTMIARINDYHGATLAAASLTGLQQFHTSFDLPLPGFLFANEPHQGRQGRPGESASDFGERLATELDELIREEGPETIAAFFVEPCPAGGGGVVLPPEPYHEQVQSVLKQHDVLLVVDEVVTGFGRTGEFFGSETFDLAPDAMALGKGMSAAYLPISAAVVSGEIFDAMKRSSDEVGFFAHGSTYSGHPACCAVALKVLDLIDELDLIAHVRSIAPGFESCLRRYADHPLVADVRAIGLMGAVEFSAEATKVSKAAAGNRTGPSVAQRVAAAAYDRGLIVRPLTTGDALQISPPLVVTEDDIDEIGRRLDAALEEVALELPEPGAEPVDHGLAKGA
jgi:4-aminobutyrate--pyruvate transaminase